MTDQQFLWWIHERLAQVHGERELTDYMHHLRAIIVDMPTKKRTRLVVRMDTDADLLRKKFSTGGGKE